MENVILFMLLFIHCSALPITHEEIIKNPQVEYLKTYGWFGGGTDDFDDEVDLSLKIQEFQEFAGLEETGTFDEPTVNKMMAPRCGIPDGNTGNQVGSRRRRGLFQGSTWANKNMTYYIGNPTKDLEYWQIKEGIENALELWSVNSALSFTEVHQAAEADLKFDFVKKRHGDGVDFDGPGNVLAHAFFPNEARGGETHFDEAETWLGPTEQHDVDGSKYNIMILAAHEIGHALGLQHTPANTESLMISWPVAYHTDFQLPADDVTSIQTLYGGPDNKLFLDLCSDTTKIQFDAVLQGPQERTLFISDIYYWEILSTGGIKQGYPKLLFELFPVSERTERLTSMDAIVMSSATNKIYVFKDDIFWRFDSNFALDADYPKLIIETGLPDQIDTAFEHDGQIYIVKKKKVFIFDEERQKTFKSTTTKLNKTFTGVPKGVSAAMTWQNGYTYFFKKDKYYKFNKKLGKVDVDYPRQVKGAWICL